MGKVKTKRLQVHAKSARGPESSTDPSAASLMPPPPTAPAHKPQMSPADNIFSKVIYTYIFSSCVAIICAFDEMRVKVGMSVVQ